MKILRPFAIAAIIAAGVAGCGNGTADSPASQPTLVATPTPTATQERETALVAPAQVFGGDCEALFTSAEIGAILGVDSVITSHGPRISQNGFTYVEQHGGVRCDWYDADLQSEVSAIVLPEAAASYLAPTGCDLHFESGATGCSLEATQNGIRISGEVHRNDNDTSALIAAQSSLLELFAQRAEDAAMVALSLPAVGAWAWPVDCVAVGAAGDFSAIPGLGAATVGVRAGGGTGAYYHPVDFALAGDFPIPHCLLRNGDVFVYFIALGGSRWAESEVTALAGATTVAVEGLDSVVLSPYYDETTRVDVFDGPNWVSFSVRYASNAGALSQALVAALDTTAID